MILLAFKTKSLYNYIKIKEKLKLVFDRDVAQFGSAPVLGTGGRRFESCHPDLIKNQTNFYDNNSILLKRP